MNPVIPFLSLALTVAVANANDGIAYKWTDAAGVTHYGDAPPAPSGAQRIELSPAPTASVGREHYYSIANQAWRLEQQRLQREKLQAETAAANAQIRQQAAQEAAALAAAEFYQRQDTVPRPVYTPVPIVGHHHHHHNRHKQHIRQRHQAHADHRGDRHPAFKPPEQWLRSDPRLWRKELRARRDHDRERQPQRTRQRHQTHADLRSDRHPAFKPPERWLRSDPRLWRKELRARRDLNRHRDRDH